MRSVLIAALGAAVLALVIAACGGSSTTSASQAAATSSTGSSAYGAPAASSSTATSSAAAPSRGASHLAIAANATGMLMFSKTSLSAKAGRVTITFTNKSPEGHNFTIRSSGGATVAATPTFNGGSRTLDVTLKPGRYTFLCTVPGHAMAGMEGTLTVS